MYRAGLATHLFDIRLLTHRILRWCSHAVWIAADTGFRDEGERFLVDFERKAWEASRQGHGEPEQQDALTVVMRAPASSRGGESGIEEGVLRELEESRGKGKDSAQALKEKRLAAAKKRMELQKKG